MATTPSPEALETTLADRPAQRTAALGRWLGGAPGAWIAWLIAVVSGILGTTYGIAELRIQPSLVEQSLLSYLAGSVVAITYASAGLFLRLRRPDVVIGWLFIAFGLVSGVSNATWAYTLLAAEGVASPGPVDPALVGWLANAALPPLWFGLGTTLAVVFPTGRPHRRVGGRLLVLTWIVAILLGVALALKPGQLLFYGFTYSPFVLSETVANVARLATSVCFAALVSLAIVSLWSLRERYREGGDVERQQLKWFGWATALLVVGGSLDGIATGPWFQPLPILPDAAWLLFSAAALAVPIAAGFAILRYRLYEIDRVISRTFVFGALTAILAGLYAASIRLFTALFVGITRETSDAALVVTTLVLATTFTPLKGRLEAFADRRLNVSTPVAAPAPELVAQVEAIARRAALEAVAETRSTIAPD